MICIRPEQPADIPGIYVLNQQAFEGPGEDALVDRLREQADPFISLVAVDDVEGDVVGHILFTPVTIEPTAPDRRLCGLAPMAVRPDRQRRGIGSRLVTAGLEACRVAGFDAVVVLGHPDYYPRLGFRPSAPLGITSQYEVGEQYFMVVELREGGLDGVRGKVRYHTAFADLV